MIVLISSGFSLVATAKAEAHDAPSPAMLESVDGESGAGDSSLEDSDWYSQAMAEIQKQEYYLSRCGVTVGGMDSLYSAPNRAQGLRMYFGIDGVYVVSRTEDPSSWILKLETAKFGRTSSMAAVARPDIVAVEDRIDYGRGILTEWFLNSPEGVKHGYEIQSSPSGHGDLVIEIAFDGGVMTTTSESRDSILVLTDLGVPVLRYNGLAVVDSSETPLPAHFSQQGKYVCISIDDSEAHYPIIVDPLLSTPSWSAQGNQAGAQFGVSVSTAGDVNGDGYDDVIVGAHMFDYGQADEGRVFGFYGSSSGLSRSVAWSAGSNVAGAGLGFSVSTAGDVNGDGFDDVIVGGYYWSKALVFTGSAWGLSGIPACVLYEYPSYTYRYGFSVSTAGDVNGDGYDDVLVGAPWEGYSDDNGVAFLYLGSPSGILTERAWMRFARYTDERFGWSVSSAGDVNGDGYGDVVIGAPYPGRVEVYHGSSSGLHFYPAWVYGDYMGGMEFGFSVSSAGDVNGDGYDDLLVGAPTLGCVFAWYGSAQGLSYGMWDWQVSSNEYNSDFGHSVSSAGDVNGDGYDDVIIGAPWYDCNGLINAGIAFMYQGSSDGLSSWPVWGSGSSDTVQTSAEFGHSVSCAGDVNGDGFDDVIIGAPLNDKDRLDEGCAFVFNGNGDWRSIAFECIGVPEGITAHVTTDSIEHELPFSAEYLTGTSLSFEYDSVVYEAGTGLISDLSWTAEIDQADAWFGYSVSSAGDVNGDGFDDVIIGAFSFDSGQLDEGCVYVFHGSSVGLSASPAWMAEGNQELACFGYSVSSAGDVNGDGFDDVIVGAPGYDNGQLDEGRAFVYYGSSAGLSSLSTWTAEGDLLGVFFGISVSSAGDVNGDGFDDVIVGAYSYDGEEKDEGRAFVYRGSSTGLSTSPAWTAEGDLLGAYFGWSVSSAGDVNGDGFDDVIVGAPSYTNGQASEGRAFVYHGSSTGLSASPAWTAESDQDLAHFGHSVSSAGDVNGDGFDDVIVGAYLYENGEGDEGRAFVYHGSSTGLSTSPAWTAEGDQAYARLGQSVSSAGDVNVDGFDDVIVGAPIFDNDQVNVGRAFVYHGSLSGLSASPAWTAEGDQVNAQFGVSVSSAGDVNGDGVDDVIVGAHAYDNGEEDEGRAFVYQAAPSDTRYVLASVSHASPLTVTESLTVTGYYEREYPVIFLQSGLGEDATGTAVTVGGVPLTRGELPYLTWVGDGETIEYGYEAVVSSETDTDYVLTSVLGPASPITVVGPVTIVGSYALGETGPPKEKTNSYIFYPPSDGWWRAQVVNNGLHSIYLTVIDLGYVPGSEPDLAERVNFMKLDCYPEGTAYSSSVYMLAGHGYEISITPYGDGSVQVTYEFTPDTEASSLSVSLLGAIGVSSGVLLFAMICLGPYLLTRAGKMSGRELPVPNATRRTYVKKVRVLRDMTDRDWSS